MTGEGYPVDPVEQEEPGREPEAELPPEMHEHHHLDELDHAQETQRRILEDRAQRQPGHRVGCECPSRKARLRHPPERRGGGSESQRTGRQDGVEQEDRGRDPVEREERMGGPEVEDHIERYERGVQRRDARHHKLPAQGRRRVSMVAR